MTKTKKILLSAIITGIITILALTTALAIFLPLKIGNNNLKELDVLAAVYDFKSFKYNDQASVDEFKSYYNNPNTEFIISTKEGFINFATTVYYDLPNLPSGPGGSSTPINPNLPIQPLIKEDISLERENEISLCSVVMENDYHQKTVKLANNIDLVDCYDYSYSVKELVAAFAGTFDGQGYTISNYYYENPSYANCSALFGKLKSGGCIKNTRFYNCGAYLAGSPGGEIYAGIIANKVESGGVIESCIVDSPYFKSGRFKSDCQVAPLVGDNAGTVKNCVVTGTYKIGGEDDNIWPINDEGLYASYFVCATNEAINCVFAATVKKDWVTTETVEPADNDKNAFEDQFSNFSSFKSAHDAWKNGVYTQCSNIPGTIEDYPNYPWFQYGNGSGVYAGTITIPLTNEQIPTYKYLGLRAFIDFTTYTIQAGEGGNVKNTLTGSVGKSAILCVPTQFEGISYTSSDGVGYASPTNYKATSDGDAIFTVETVADQYYIFDGWNDTTATFKRNKTIIQFASVTVGGTTIYDSEEIVVDYLDGEPLGDPNYDKTNHTLTYTYSVDGTPTTFVYNFADENAWTVDVTNGSAYSWDATGSAKLTITPTFKLKEYGSVWQ